MANDDQMQKHAPDTQGTEPDAGSEKNERAHAIAEAARIQELRERLYARGATVQAPRHTLPKREMADVHEIHDTIEEPPEKDVDTPRSDVRTVSPIPPPLLHTPVAATVSESTVPYNGPMVSTSRRKSLRKKIALLGVAFFVLAVGVASFIMLRGNNTISGDNIALTVTGPIAVGGGEDFPFQISIANQNAISIESATLIIEYPKGTHSAEEGNREIATERKQLETVESGELLNVEMMARIFGEENEEKEIKVSVDYRVAGSNATFHKEAAPLCFKVSTSPVVMTFDAVKTISSGQEIELTLTVQSNSPTPLDDLLVKVTYPEGFDYSESKPEPISGEDTWRIGSLKPAEKKILVIKGLMTGYEDEKRRFVATGGVANASDQNALASMLAKAQTEVTIEQPFLDVGVSVNGNKNDPAIITTNEPAQVEIEYKNALDMAIYDGKVLVELSGNALNEFEVKPSNGFYDSTKNTITWDAVDETSLKEILPGKVSRLSFTLNPREDIGRTPELAFKVTVRGQRVFEDRVPQELVGTASRTIKVESVPVITSAILYGEAPFTNTGPIPPVAERVTQYTYMLIVKAGTNDITGAEITAVIPQYVSWLDLITDDDDVTYNATTRTMRWNIGNMDANSEKQVAVQVSFLPSLSQVGTTPTILEAQRLKATDRFTGTTVRAEHPALTTSLYDATDEEMRDGKVRESE